MRMTTLKPLGHTAVTHIYYNHPVCFYIIVLHSPPLFPLCGVEMNPCFI